VSEGVRGIGWVSGGCDGRDGVTWLAIMPSPLALTKCQKGRRQEEKTKSNEGKGKENY